MNYRIATTEDFERNFKRLFKKYGSLKNDLADFVKELRKNPTKGKDLGNNTRKIRMAITSKNRGKSGGARIITYHVFVDEINTKIYLLTIYDKNERKGISKKEINDLKRINNID